MVGTGHQRETAASQSASRRCQEVPDRICSPCSSRRSSVNDQQSLRPQEPAAHYHQHALGTLLSRGTPLKALSTQDAYIIYVRNWIVPRWPFAPRLVLR